MTSMHKFGDPERFEIAARWLQDQEPRDRLPKEFGWSMGELCIKVGGVTLTEHQIHGKSQEAIQWYLGPVVAWLIGQWKWLMHEEAYTWRTHSADSAAVTVSADLERYIVSEYAPDRAIYKEVREWWSRHALHAADSSALYPDIFIRRVDDNIEISWLDGQPEFPPEGFELKLKPGTALFPVKDVAKPLWDFLQWAVDSPPCTTPDDLLQAQALSSQLAVIQKTDAEDLEAAHLANTTLRSIMEKVRNQSHWIPNRKVLHHIPVISEFDTPALMFGGLSVNLEEPDIRSLFTLLTQHQNGNEKPNLKSIVSSPSIYEYIQPYTHGYELAYSAREKLGIDHDVTFVDIEAILKDLDITIQEQALQTSSIRGVALAGAGFSPAILINTSSLFNTNKRGRRFTLAHELCHILFDRSNAKRLSHVSGPWASARVEKRANAFAAMFLATPHALSKALNNGDSKNQVKHLSEKFGIGTRALREHMHNLDLLSDEEFLLSDDRRH